MASGQDLDNRLRRPRLSAEELGSAFADVLTVATGQETVAAGQPRRLSSGASRESWVLEVAHGEQGTRRYVVQLYPERHVGTGLTAVSEARLLAVAREAGVPVPRVIAAGGPGGPPGAAFLVTEWIDGETLPSRMFRDPVYRPGLAGLHKECASALARIHDLPVDLTKLRSLDPIEPYQDDLAASGQSHPALEWAYRWLVQNRPAGNPPCVVHGDFRLGNLMVDQRGLRAVLDWELAHVGDPYEDVAWPMVRAWRFDHVRPAGVFPDRESWLSAYGEATGLDVDPDIVRWWEIAGTFKWGVICLTQWLRHRDGSTRSVELAAIGRRVAENEYDLLRLIP